ncbi:MAG TPA: hypothetical protein PK400_09990 [Phycisphaerales bacterium]|nr:hypothetical protein [Phycisphaerales bacterium]HRQ76278.1 hypothetical protein [Phycisphaerales bacterium]
MLLDAHRRTLRRKQADKNRCTTGKNATLAFIANGVLNTTTLSSANTSPQERTRRTPTIMHMAKP